MHWQLEPKLVRELRTRGMPHDENAVRNAELNLVAKAREWSAPEFSGNRSDQMILSLLQHSGVPTGFLDLTTDPMTALWFACESIPRANTPKLTGVLLAFDVTDWPVLPTEIPAAEISYAHMENPLGFFYKTYLETSHSFVIEPTRPSPRMMAQRGKLFRAPVSPTATSPFGIVLDGISDNAPEFGPQQILSVQRSTGRPASLPFVAILIGTQHKARFRSHLSGTYGLNRSTLFPDVSGFADAVNHGTVPY